MQGKKLSLRSLLNKFTKDIQMSTMKKLLFSHDRAVLLNDRGLLTYQPSTNSDDIAIASDGEGAQYWTPVEALALAKAILAHEKELIEQQDQLDALLNPVADLLLKTIDEKKIKRFAHGGWGWFLNEAHNTYMKLFMDNHPLILDFLQERNRDEFSHYQMLDLLNHTLHQKVRARYPQSLFLTQGEQDEEENKHLTIEMEPVVTASCYSDDHVYELQDIDVTLWFTWARDDELLALRRCGYGGKYEADEVLRYVADTNAPVRKMFEYIEALPEHIEARGFECHVNIEEAEAWIAQHRPHLNEIGED